MLLDKGRNGAKFPTVHLSRGQYCWSQVEFGATGNNILDIIVEL